MSEPPRTPPDPPEDETIVAADWAVRPEGQVVVEQTHMLRRCEQDHEPKTRERRADEPRPQPAHERRRHHERQHDGRRIRDANPRPRQGLDEHDEPKHRRRYTWPVSCTKQVLTAHYDKLKLHSG